MILKSCNDIQDFNISALFQEEEKRDRSMTEIRT